MSGRGIAPGERCVAPERARSEGDERIMGDTTCAGGCETTCLGSSAALADAMRKCLADCI